MGIKRTLSCLLGFHFRLGREVRWDGLHYRTVCRHCGAMLYKHQNVRWRAIGRRRETLLLTYRKDNPA